MRAALPSTLSRCSVVAAAQQLSAFIKATKASATSFTPAPAVALMRLAMVAAQLLPASSKLGRLSFCLFPHTRRSCRGAYALGSLLSLMLELEVADVSDLDPAWQVSLGKGLALQVGPRGVHLQYESSEVDERREWGELCEVAPWQVCLGQGLALQVGPHEVHSQNQ